MKKINYLLIAVATVAAASCTLEMAAPEVAVQGTKLEFGASFETATRTTLNASTKVEWLSTDEINVFADNVNEKNIFTVQDAANGLSVKFEGYAKTKAAEGGSYYALYPASAFVKFDTGKSKIQYNVPAEQGACVGGFADGVNVAVARTAGENLEFKNVCAFACVDVQQDGITRLALSGNNSETLAGTTCKMTLALDGDPVQSDNPAGDKYTTVYIGDGQTPLEKGMYYFVLLPNKNNQKVDFTKGLTLTLTNGAGKSVVKSSETAVAIERNHVLPLGEISGVEFVNKLSVPKTSVKVGDIAGTYEIAVSSSTGWTAEVSGEGFSIDKTSGTGDDVITVSYEVNENAEASRDGIVTITSADPDLDPVVVLINQAAKDVESNVKMWNFSDWGWELGNYSESFSHRGLTVNATSEKGVSIDENGKSWTSEDQSETLEFTQRLKFNGTGNADARNVSVPVATYMSVEIWGMSGSKDAVRPLLIANPDGTEITRFDVTGTELNYVKFTYTGSQKNLLVMSGNSGINIYAIRTTKPTSIPAVIIDPIQ